MNAPGGAGHLHRADVAAIIPCRAQPPAATLVGAVLAHVDRVVLVDDGMAATQARRLDALAASSAHAAAQHLPAHAGKGHALVAGIATLAAGPVPPRAVLMIDADGQHPPAAIPSFLAAAGSADLVIGDRLCDARGMPLVRRAANTVASRLLSLTARTPVPDSQCGMRLLCRRALDGVAFRGGGMEAETLHLKRCLRAGVPVAWVPIPALYAGEPSTFRAVRDSVAILTAAAMP